MITLDEMPCLLQGFSIREIRRPIGSLAVQRATDTDSAGTTREARQRLVPVAVIRAGRRQPIAPLVTVAPAGISPVDGGVDDVVVPVPATA